MTTAERQKLTTARQLAQGTRQEVRNAAATLRTAEHKHRLNGGGWQTAPAVDAARATLTRAEAAHRRALDEASLLERALTTNARE